MKLTNQCKEAFIEWYKSFEPKSDWKYPAYEYFENHDLSYKISVLTEFFDSYEIFSKIDPYLGGGQPVFYGYVCFRNRENATCELDIPTDGEPIYSTYRYEIQEMCLNLSNDVFNELNDPVIHVLKDKELDDLPF